MPPTLAEQIGVEPLQPGEYVSKVCAIRMGNAMPIAYGGCTLGVAVSAACATVPPSLSLYSVLGHYLGPASTTQKLYCSVQKTRDTRSFATRRVQVKQKQPNGEFRTCMELLADFHVDEPSLLTYSAPPVSTFSKPEDCPTVETHLATLQSRGDITEAQAQGFKQSFAASADYFDTRYCVNGVASQNLSGAAKHVQTTQDDRHITAKTSGEWQRTRETNLSKSENLAALAFLMDMALSFLPLTHNHLWFEDAAACSSLDFAFRVFTPDVKLDSWHLREKMTSHGGGGRTYSEGRLWDEQGNLVASMTQQSILRPKKDSAKPSL